MTPEALFTEIEKVAPGFRAVVAEHMQDNDGLLSHVLMADLLRYICASINSASEKAASEFEMRAVLSVLELGAACGNPETENVVAVSFCEGLELEPCFSKLRPFLGIALRRILKQQGASIRAR